ncbi:hypothetical protein B0T37_22075, partial [Chromobacterium violaceum]
GITRSDYDSAGQRAISTDLRGVKTVYQYDAAGRTLSRTVDPDGLKLTTQTSYDAQGRALRQTEPGGRVTENRYDANGRLQAVIVDPDGLKLTTSYDYDAQGQKVRVTEAAGTPQAKVIEYEYDGAGRRVRETVDPAGLKQSTRYVYDGNGNVSAKTDAAGNVTRYVYDGNDRLRYSVDPLGQVTEQRYDAAGNVTDTIRYAKTLAQMGVSSEQAQQGIGANILKNGLFAPLSVNQVAGWSYYGWRANADVGVNLNADWRVADGLPGENTVYLHQTGRDPQDAYQDLSQGFSVQAGHRYAFSAYTGAHRATASVHIVWYDANGKSLGSTSEQTEAFSNPRQMAGGPQLSGYKRCVADGIAPPGAVSGTVVLRKRNTDAGENDSWLFATRAQFEELSLEATGPSEWKPALVADAADQHTRTFYDAAGRPTYTVNAAGSVTKYEYDAAGRILAKRELANAVPNGGGVKLKNKDGQWHAVWKELGAFKAGDVVTATIRFKAPAGLKGMMFLGNSRGPHAYDNSVDQTRPGDDGWQTLTLTHQMTGHDDDLQVYIYNMVASADSNAGVVYDNLRVSSEQRGEVLSESFTRFDPVGQGWNVGAEYEQVQSSLSQVGSREQLAAFLPTLLDPKRDQVTYYMYDGAGRQHYTIDPSGQVTEQRYDAAGNVTDTIRYAKTLAQMGVSSEQAQQGIGANILKNGLFAPLSVNQVAGWSYYGWRANADVGVNLNADWRVADGLPGENTVYLHQTGRDPQDAYQDLSQGFSVQAGHRYAFSAYTGAHRATASVHIVWYDANGKSLGSTSEQTEAFSNPRQMAGGPQLSGYKRCVADGIAPPGAVSGTVVLRKRNTDAGENDSWLFATRAQFEELSLEATGPSEWKPALVADPADQHSRTVYDAAGRPTFSIDAQGYVTERRYDAAGNVTDTIRYAKPIIGNLVGSPNAVNSDWLYPYSVATVPAA